MNEVSENLAHKLTEKYGGPQENPDSETISAQSSSSSIVKIRWEGNCQYGQRADGTWVLITCL
jgi:hypothetical protein